MAIPQKHQLLVIGRIEIIVLTAFSYKYRYLIHIYIYLYIFQCINVQRLHMKISEGLLNIALNSSGVLA